MSYEPTEEEIDALYRRLGREADAGGYHLNPDGAFTKDLVQGLLVNEKRYGYPSCPCRLATGVKEEDLDIICPCDYRDPDVGEHGACYCGLYVSEAVRSGQAQVHAIPERRPPADQRRRAKARLADVALPPLPFPVWRCSVCGYLCARTEPPEVCPICKVKRDRFKRFL